jgi:glutaredoxin
MSTRSVEVFVAGCSLCDEAVAMVKRLACPSCEVTIRDMSEPDTARHARSLGVRSVPAVVVDGQLLGCCGSGVDETALRNAGVGTPMH